MIFHENLFIIFEKATKFEILVSYIIVGALRVNLDNLACHPLVYTMNHPRIIVSNLMEEFISMQRVNP